MREIILDTETTGLDPASGHRIVEIGCIELINHIPTGKVFHKYINPERSQDDEVIKIHGLTDEFLADKPTFTEIVDEFLMFLGSDSTLVIHNAPFDMKFLNAELSLLKKETLSHAVIDTVMMARAKFPGQRANLNELCKRFEISLESRRDYHGALIDCHLLAQVYIELLGGKEPGLKFSNKNKDKQNVSETNTLPKRAPRTFEIPATELEEHQKFLTKIKTPLWLAE